MQAIITKLGWGTTLAAIIGGAFLLSKFTGAPIAVAAASAAFGALQKLRESASWPDAGLTAAPGVVAGAGAYFLG
jgi:hypothetical protein